MGGLFFVTSYVLLVFRGKFGAFHPYGTISSFLIRLFSWIPGSLSFFHSWSCSKCWRPILLEVTFSRSVRSLLDNVALVLLSRSYRFSGSKDPPLSEVVFLLPKVLSFFGSKDPSLLEVVLHLPKVSLFSWK